MTEFKDYYELLNIERSADVDRIRTAIKEMRKRYRRIESSPDQQQRANAERVMALLAEAEGVLLDDSQRAQYDAQYLANKDSQSRQQQAERSEAMAERKDWTAEAQAYYDNGQYNNALFAASEATRINPADEMAWYLRTWSAYNINRFDEAEFAANEMIKLAPDIASMHAILGDIYSDQGRIDAAVSEYKIGESLDSSAPYYPMRIAYLTFLRNTEEGVKQASEAHAKFPEDGTIRDLLALALLTSAQEGMSHVEDTYYFTNERQIAHAKAMLAKVDELGPIEDEDVRALKGQMARSLEESQRNTYVAPPNWYAILLGLHILFAFLGGLRLGVHYLVLLFLVVYGAIFVFPKQYKVNARVLGEAARQTGLQ